MIKQLKTKQIYENPWLSLREDEVEFDEKVRGIYTVIDKPDFALIIPFDGEFLYLVKQYRYPFQDYFLEFPGGSHEEGKLEDATEVARAELAEETGLLAGKMEKLGILREVPATINQQGHYYLATDLVHGEQNLEETESELEVIRMSIQEFEEAVVEQKITDCKTLAAYFLWQQKTKKEVERKDSLRLESRPTPGIGVLVFNRQGQLLLGKRKSLNGRGTWSVPGGHLERMETLDECARREVEEETGLQIKKERVLDYCNYIDREHNQHFLDVYMTGELIDPEQVPELRERDKCEGWQWFDLDKLPRPLFREYGKIWEKSRVRNSL